MSNQLTEATWSLIEKTADHIWDSGVAQECRLKHRSTVVLTLLKGFELGLPLMSALEHVRLIHGHFSLSAECQQALVLGRIPNAKFEWLHDGTGGVAEVTGERPGQARVTVRFTHEDAVKTGMAERNPIYRTFPGNLLRSAAMRGLCKRLFPDVLLGVEAATEEDVEHAEATQRDTTPPAAPPALAATAATEPKEAKATASTSADVVCPEDAMLPFTSGKWHGLRLANLSVDDLGAMLRGFSKRRDDATAAKNEEGIRVNAQWVARVTSWLEYWEKVAQAA